MLKKVFISILFTQFIFYSIAQTPSFYLSWDKRYGGSQDDAIGWFEKTTDGGLILGGTTYSGISGDISEPSIDTSMQTSDFWLVKTDASGVKLWDKRLGGTKTDQLSKILQTSDGGYIAAGITYSGIGADKSEPNWDPTEISNDFWIIKTDNAGNKIWDKRFGGTTFDLFAGVKQTINGGYILCGSTLSDISGNVTQPTQGSWDFWVIRIDSVGNIIWDKRFGGTGDDFATAIDLSVNGGFIVGGYSNSNAGGDKSEPSQGTWDYWVVRIGEQGTLIWDKTIGGTLTDWMFDLTKTNDGGVLLGGQSFSGATGDKSEPNHDTIPSGSDRWIVKLSNLGVKMWDKTFGGYEVEDLSRVNQTADGGFLLCGESYSGLNGDKTEDNLGVEQTWIVKTDSTGVFEWDKTVFTLGHDESGTAIMYDSLCFISVNYTAADSGGYKSEPSQGDGDYWIAKICMDDPSSVIAYDSEIPLWQIFPNPAAEFLYLTTQSSVNEIMKMEIIDLKGRKLIETEELVSHNNEIKLDVSSLPGGFYFCRIVSEKIQEVKKFIIEN